MHESGSEHTIESILASNDEIAAHNREHFDELGILAVNFMSAPGAGKTTLLSETIPFFLKDQKVCVIEGDMVGNLDAERLASTGVPVLQISTGKSCHLDAQMVARLLHQEALTGCELLFVENVGNLVCPAEFPLGEHKRVVLLSVTEGDDKPLKYPVIFHNADAVVFTKCDLIPHVNFDLKAAASYVRNINPDCAIFSLSVKTQEGMKQWLSWLDEQLKTHQSQVPGKGNYVHSHSS